MVSLIDKNRNFGHKKVIPKRYLNLIEEVLEKCGSEFKEKYYKSTIDFDIELKDGEYCFLDPVVNELTGHY